MTNEFDFTDYPHAVIAFEVDLPDRLRAMQEWLDASSDGLREGRWVFFQTNECAEQFVTRYGEVILGIVDRPHQHSNRYAVESTFAKTIRMLEDRARITRGGQ